MKKNVYTSLRNNKPIIFAIIFGLLGSVFGGIIFFSSIMITGWIFGIITYGTGALASFLSVWGYSKGGGKLKKESEIMFMRFYAYFVGLLSGIFSYFGLYLLLLLIGVYTEIGVYITDMGIDIFDAIFIGIGALGGRWGLTVGVRHFYKKEVKKAEKQMEKTEKITKEQIKEPEKRAEDFMNKMKKDLEKNQE